MTRDCRPLLCNCDGQWRWQLRWSLQSYSWASWSWWSNPTRSIKIPIAMWYHHYEIAMNAIIKDHDCDMWLCDYEEETNAPGNIVSKDFQVRKYFWMDHQDSFRTPLEQTIYVIRLFSTFETQWPCWIFEKKSFSINYPLEPLKA